MYALVQFLLQPKPTTKTDNQFCFVLFSVDRCFPKNVKTYTLLLVVYLMLQSCMFLHFLESACQQRIRQRKIGCLLVSVVGFFRHPTVATVEFLVLRAVLLPRVSQMKCHVLCHLETEHLKHQTSIPCTKCNGKLCMIFCFLSVGISVHCSSVRMQTKNSTFCINGDQNTS